MLLAYLYPNAGEKVDAVLVSWLIVHQEAETLSQGALRALALLLKDSRGHLTLSTATLSHYNKIVYVHSFKVRAQPVYYTGRTKTIITFLSFWNDADTYTGY